MGSSRFQIACLCAMLGLIVGTAASAPACAQPFAYCEPTWRGTAPQLTNDWFIPRCSFETDPNARVNDTTADRTSMLFGHVAGSQRCSLNDVAGGATNATWLEQFFGIEPPSVTGLGMRFDSWSVPAHRCFEATRRNDTYLSIDLAHLQYPLRPNHASQSSPFEFWMYNRSAAIDDDTRTPCVATIGHVEFSNDQIDATSWFFRRDIGATNLLSARPVKIFGVGWYDASTNSQTSSIITKVLTSVGNGRGLECYYDYQWTPTIRLTPGVQAIMPAQEQPATALVAGARAQMVF